MTINNTIDSVLTELHEMSGMVANEQVEAFIKELTKTNHIFLAGSGRSGLVIQGFANRLMHLGFSVSLVGEISSPHSKKGDLVIICSGSGETPSLVSLSNKAKESNVNVALVTTNKLSTIGRSADVVVELPGGNKLNNQTKDLQSIQPMGTSFEQLSFLLFDSIVLELMNQLKETPQQMFERHANFE